MAIPFETDAGAGAEAAFGLIVLSNDESLEPEIASALPRRGIALHHARIPSAPAVTVETLKRMEADLPRTTALLPERPYAAIGYGCTSGATVIGPERVAALVQGARHTDAVVDPLSAVIAACRALGVTRIGFLTPYVAEVSAAMRARLEAAGLQIASFGSFEQADEQTVARISETSTLNGLLALGSTPGVEAVFASCTNLRTFGIVEEAEAQLGCPVLSSNLALAWAMCRAAGIAPAETAPGRLLGSLRPPRR